MADSRKILEQMRREPANVRFGDLEKVCEAYFGKPRQAGTSHAIFKTPLKRRSANQHSERQGQGEDVPSAAILLAIDNWRGCAMSVDHYTFRVTWSPEDGKHVGLCAEFPSLSGSPARPKPHSKASGDSLLRRLPTCRRPANPSPRRLRRSITAVNSVSAFRPRYIGRWRFRRRSKA